MGNWPGTTVEVGSGVWGEMTLLDLPGAYSLDPLSPDEALTRDLLTAERPPDLVVVAVDAAHLARSLYLVACVRELAVRTVVVVTMSDVAMRRGIHIDPLALQSSIGAPVVSVDPRAQRGHDGLDGVVRRSLALPPPSPRDRPAGDDVEVADARFAWIEDVVDEGTHHASDHARETWTDRVDRVVLAPIAGPLVFLAAMWLVFQITTTVAAPLQDWLDQLVSGPVSDAVTSAFTLVGLGASPILGFVRDGLVAGVGTVLTFVPLMALMFALLALLEDSGYLARAAVVTDRTMRRLGLPGKAFLPLVVGFGCNVPAIAATRILGSVRQRVLVALLVPFTSCSARLTVYVMLATIFFPGAAGTVVFVMYLVSIALVLVVGLALRRTLWRTVGADPLVIDLPPYQRPTLRLTASVTWVRLRGFLSTAGGIIVATVAVVWLLQSTPVSGAGSFGDVPVDRSAYAAAAKAVTPVVAPAGFGQWETTSALVVGFVAKEAVISSWAQTYAVAEDDAGLGPSVRAAFDHSSGGHPLPAVAAFMIFLLAYTPCVATLAAQKREIGLRWTVVGFAIQLTVAWALAVAVFQIGRLFW